MNTLPFVKIESKTFVGDYGIPVQYVTVIQNAFFGLKMPENPAQAVAYVHTSVVFYKPSLPKLSWPIFLFSR